MQKQRIATEHTTRARPVLHIIYYLSLICSDAFPSRSALEWLCSCLVLLLHDHSPYLPRVDEPSVLPCTEASTARPEKQVQDVAGEGVSIHKTLKASTQRDAVLARKRTSHTRAWNLWCTSLLRMRMVACAPCSLAHANMKNAPKQPPDQNQARQARSSFM